MNYHAPNLLKNFGYSPLFATLSNTTDMSLIDQPVEAVIPNFIKEFNEVSLKFSQKNLFENDKVTSLLINHPKLLLRKK